MTATLGTLAACNVNGSAIHGLQGSSVDPGIVAQALASDGYESPTRVLLADQQPAADFDSSALDTLLALNSSKFAYEGVALSGNGFEGFFATLSADGGRASTGTQFAVANGLLIPVSLVVPHDGPGTITSRVIGRSSDGATVPIAVSTGQSLPAYAAHNEYSAGPCEYNGTAIDKVQRVQVDFNIRVEVLQGDGDIYSDTVVRMSAQPMITISTLDVAIANAIGIGGVRQGETDSDIYLRKWDVAGNRVATGSAVHIKLSIQGNNSLIYPAAVRASQHAIGGVDVIYSPIFDGTNPVITVATTSAIS